MILKLFFCAETICSIRNASSPMLSVDDGVLQATMVGSIWFIMFINDILRSFCGTKMVNYAEDTSAFISD